MKKIFGLAAATLLALPLAGASAAPSRSETAVLAGGCFWGMETVFEHVKGVRGVVSGYAGGSAADAKYDSVSSERTGHAEAVRITYDPAQISYPRLLEIFFTVAHDPTQVDRQGPDTGKSYRSAIFPQSPTAVCDREELHRQAQRGACLQGADRHPHRERRLLSGRGLSPAFRREAPLLSVHRNKRPPKGRGPPEALPKPLESLSFPRLNC